MINIALNKKTIESIVRSTGIPFAEIRNLDAESIDKRIEENKKKPILRNSKRDRRLPARGTVFLTLKRYIKLSDIDKKLSKI